MKQVLAVFLKELVDNIRDRRTVISALIYGPILVPLFMLGSLSVGVSSQKFDVQVPLSVYVNKVETFAFLEDFLAEENIRLLPTGLDYKEKIAQGEYSVVLHADPDFKEQFSKGRPADIWVYYSSDRKNAISDSRRLMYALSKYSQTLMTLRLQVRGFDQALLKPFNIIDSDLAAVGQSGQFLPRILALVVMMAMTLGGFYLAVDSCAGERERHSLESLLALPVPRTVLVLGKLAAISFFVYLSGIIALCMAATLASVLPLDIYADVIKVDVKQMTILALHLLPLSMLMASLMLFISTFSKTVKEAQTHLALVIFIPMVPFFVSQFAELGLGSKLWSLPVLGQFALMNVRLGGGSTYASSELLLAVLTITLTAILMLLTIVRFRDEAMLNG